MALLKMSSKFSTLSDVNYPFLYSDRRMQNFHTMSINSVELHWKSSFDKFLNSLENSYSKFFKCLIIIAFTSDMLKSNLKKSLNYGNICIFPLHNLVFHKYQFFFSKSCRFRFHFFI